MHNNVFVHPAQYYARYLALVLDDPRKELNPALGRCGVAEMDDTQIEQAIDSVREQPPDFRPWDASHQPSAGSKG